MLLSFVIIYWIISVGIGIYAAKWVHNSRDFAVAGRRMPMYIVTATVFATWFGSETVLGIPATFMKEGFSGIIADPFGSSLCLILVGLFFARPLYRMNLLTIGDYYRKRYSRPVEMLTTLCIVISYLGWVGAQIKALGLVFFVVSGGSVTQEWGMIIGASTVLVYTVLGGMFSVAITDFIQMIIIVLGMLYIAFAVSGIVPGGAEAVITHAANNDKFQILPKPELKEVLWFLAAWMTMMLGSIPQQDVFQRVQSAKSEDIAARSAIVGGIMYFCFAFIPMYLAYSASLIDPAMVSGALKEGGDAQLILPNLILSPIVPIFAQIMFFGALLSAIKSCASATLLAPSVSFSENILRPFFPNIPDHKFLQLMRVVLVGFTILVTSFAMSTDASIYKMVENAYKVTLVGAFVPLVCGLYWKRATNLGGMLAVLFGLVIWIGCEYYYKEATVPPQMAGLIASFAGMIIGSLAFRSLQREATA
ncbi:Osmoregulated proline transporter OpuE [Usitatibacter rugosus]|uniref:Osmoregulated proline transporter OpuE n=1 Tax=Usitatibacter rugosus TaxID=2732067 RepID=A0A6M4H367_9PROT|nr:sodium:solute symporter family protein [Usitatibacter rugosus]QJR13004.1 Osmoregulated proline transporter OpuE [Usitatibacter rugosus]